MRRPQPPGIEAKPSRPTAADAQARPSPQRAWWRVLLFVGLFAAALALYRSPIGAPLERALIEQLTVPAAAALLQALDSAADVRAAGSRLTAPGGGLNVLHGCEGSDVALLLAAALLVAPMGWRWRLAGLVVGVALLFALNLGRVLLLFYAFRLAPQWFDVLHGLVAPLVLVAVACLGFVAWLRLATRRADEAPAAATA